MPLAAVALIAGLAPGCRHATAPSQGRASFIPIEPAAPRGERGRMEVAPQQAMEVFEAARPLGTLASPIYPPVALKARVGIAVVSVRLTVGTDGRVTQVGPSLTGFSTPGPFAAEFRTAVEAAVAQWRFRPAEIRHLEQVQHPNGAYQRLRSREPVETTMDFSFTFTADGMVAPHEK